MLLTLKKEYHDIPRTFSDVAQALSLYQTLRPRTDVYSMSRRAFVKIRVQPQED